MQGQTIKDAAKELGMSYAAAKRILTIYRKTGRLSKLPTRTPKGFDVENLKRKTQLEDAFNVQAARTEAIMMRERQQEYRGFPFNAEFNCE